MLEGIRALTHLFLALGEYRAAWASADELLDLLAEAGVQEAWWKGRNLRPKNRDDQPEVFWTRAITAIEDARTHTSASNENGPSLSLMLSDSEFELITRDSAVTKDVAAALQ